MTTTFPVPAWKPLWDGHLKPFREPEVVKGGSQEEGRIWEDLGHILAFLTRPCVVGPDGNDSAGQGKQMGSHLEPAASGAVLGLHAPASAP